MREKLIEILRVPIYPHELADPTEAVADYLLDNDVVPVVRCKDCLSYQETIGKDSGKPCGYGSCYNPCAIITGIVYDEDFCSYGERRSDAETD